MIKLQHSAVLTDLNGDPAIRINVSGDATLLHEGKLVPLIEARGIWEEGNGDEWEFDQACSYVDSLR